MFRGEKEEVLDLTLDPEDGRTPRTRSPTTSARIAAAVRHRRPRAAPADKWLRDTVRWAWRTRILVAPRHRPADAAAAGRRGRGASRVFAANLRDLLLAAPAGTRATMGLDPGLRTGVKVAVVDAHRQGRRHRHDLPARAAARLGRVARDAGASWPRAHDVELIAIGNGTASRETDKLAGELIAAQPGAEADQGGGVRGRRVGVLRVRLRLAGAARTWTSRCAARSPSPAACRTRSPSWSRSTRSRSASASTSTTCPRSKLSRSLDAVVEDCVNARRRRRQHRLGAAADAGSPGIGAGLAENIVAHRDANGPFRTPHARSRTCRGWARRRSSSAPASCASAAATTRSTPPACTPRRTRWCGGSSRATGGDVATLIGNTAVLRALQPDRLRRRHVRPADRHRHPRRAGEAGPRPAPGVQDRRPSPRASRRSPTCGRAWCWRAWSPTSPRSARSSTSACTRTAWCTSRRCRSTFVKDPRDVVKSGDVVRVKVLDVDDPAQADLADPAAGRRAGRGRQAGPARRAARR